MLALRNRFAFSSSTIIHRITRLHSRLALAHLAKLAGASVAGPSGVT
jgi:hypothetical protein